jgi:hypothetical protein
LLARSIEQLLDTGKITLIEHLRGEPATGGRAARCRSRVLAKGPGKKAAAKRGREAECER